MRRALATLLALLVIGSLIGAIHLVDDPKEASARRLESASLTAASIAFPPANAISVADVDNLTSLLVSALELAPVNLTVRNPQGGLACCLYDMDGRNIAMNMSSVAVRTKGDAGMNIFYSPSGRLAELDIIGGFGTSLATKDWSSMVERVRLIGDRLGLAAFPLSFKVSNESSLIGGGPTQRRTIVAMYSGIHGSQPAFGNQLIVTFNADQGIAIRLALFPWFTSTPPAISAGQAISLALNYLNTSVIVGNPWLSNGSHVSSFRAGLALDSFRYALVYHVEAAYEAASGNPSEYPRTVSYDYRVWVDAYDGMIAYWTLVPPPPGQARPESPLWSLWVVGVIIASSLLIAMVVLYLEPIQFAAASFLLPLYFRLKRESVLEHFVRGQVYAYVSDHPGVTFSELRDKFSLNNGTTTYHLAVLLAMGFLRTDSDGRHKRFFISTVSGVELGRTLSDLQYRILDTIREQGPATPSSIAKALSISRQRAGYNLRSLTRFGVVSESSEKSGVYMIQPSLSPASEKVLL